MPSGGLFAEWQPQYAAHGIATFPVRDKRPLVSNYLQMGLPASWKLVTKFPDADGIGLACGKRSGITVVDIDSFDERLLADALDRFGNTPFLVRTGSHHHQAWYRHNGEQRSIRPHKPDPIDILGGGFVVAPPSRTSRGTYALISGSLDDLASLPTIRSGHRDLQECAVTAPNCAIRRGERNNELWRMCMVRARECGDWGELLDFAEQANRERLEEPLPSHEVAKIVRSAWSKEMAGENLVGGRRGIIVSNEHVDELLSKWPDAFVLLVYLKRLHWGRQFVCANAMAQIMPPKGWTRPRFTSARTKLEQLGEIVRVRGASYHHPALYRLKGVEI